MCASIADGGSSPRQSFPSRVIVGRKPLHRLLNPFFKLKLVNSKSGNSVRNFRFDAVFLNCPSALVVSNRISPCKVAFQMRVSIEAAPESPLLVQFTNRDFICFIY